MSNPYYHEQLSFLLEEGPALAKAFPRAADRLAGTGTDPDVERLLEGIAFIAGRIHQKHDQSVGEICQAMFDIFFPHYLCPVPSTSIVEFNPESISNSTGEFHREKRYIPSGTEIRSAPVLGTPCCFRTVYDVNLSSLRIEDVAWHHRGNRGAQLILHLTCREKEISELRQRGLLRLYLHGEPLLTRSLFHWMLTGLEHFELLDEHGKVLATHRTPIIRQQGLNEEDALYMYPPGSFSGFRLLQEYFTLPQKFMFLEVADVGSVLAHLPRQSENEWSRFALRFTLRAEVAHAFSMTRQNIRLYCTPVVNLFAHTADPILREIGKTDYLVRPAGPSRHYQIYRLLEVIGRAHKSNVYYPLLSEIEEEPGDGAFCQLIRKTNQGEVFNYITFHDAQFPPPLRQTILIDLLCSNGQLPTGLRVGDIAQPRSPLEQCHCRFVIPLTQPVELALDEMLRWRLVKHLAFSGREDSSLEGLREVLMLYSSHAARDRQATRALEVIQSSLLLFEEQASSRRYRRGKIWGRTLCLTVDETAFENKGDLYLLGCILDEFFAIQTAINLFSEFNIRCNKSMETYRWPPRIRTTRLENY